MTLPTDSRRAPALVGLCPGRHVHEFYMPLEPGDRTVCPECDEQMVVYVTQAVVERLLAVLKGIAESPESRDALQVLAWQTYTRESPEWVLADDPQNPANQVPDFSKGKS